MDFPRTGKAHFVTSALMILGTLALAVIVAAALILRREPPRQVIPSEAVIAVEVARMTAEDEPILIVGHGEARPIEIVPLTPQVSGNVVRVHERLFEGEVIAAGELLIEIDPQDYQTALEQARAQAAQARSGLSRLRTQYAADRERMATAQRTRDLARNEFERVRALFEEEAVGALANVERAEMNYNQARDAHDLLVQNIEVFPARISEAEQGLIAAEAAVVQAEITVERTRILAPFDGRIKEKRVERGQFVAPGAPILVLANDAVLEIPVPLDSRDARTGLRFAPNDANLTNKSWFRSLEPVPVRVSWTEDPSGRHWTGRLDRVIAFDETTRTVTVAVRVTADEARATDARLPLVEGMFCRVEIPGQVMERVYRLPRAAVTFENQVYVVLNGRLMPRDVQVLRTQRDQAFIQEGLSPNELVVITRLVDPLPNTRVAYDDAAIPSSDALGAPLSPARAEGGL